jgi:hypothetical protein
MKSWRVSVILTVAVLVAIVGMVLHFQERRPVRRQLAEEPMASPKQSGAVSSSHAGVRIQPPLAPDKNEPEAEKDEPDPVHISREKIEEYLKLHHRNSASLLAAFHAAADVEHPESGIDYLKEAATNFPGDPHVQWTVLSQNAFPEDRRKWLDAFKTSSSNNSLANYLSASDYFKNGQPDAALRELAEATGKAQFADFAMETYLGSEEISRFGEASPFAANIVAMSAMSADLLPELASLKTTVHGIRDAQKQYVDSGDSASVQNLSQMGAFLASRLTTGDGGRFVISHLVGIATETIALQSLDQHTSYDFLGSESPAQRLEDLKQQKQDIRALSAGFNSSFFNATEAEKSGYTERMKIYGEIAAMRWLLHEHPPDATQSYK